MAELVTRETVEVMVDFYGFALQDEDDMEVPVPFPEERDETRQRPFLTVFDGRLDFESAGHTHEATLVFEVWTGEPLPDGSERWEAQGEAAIHSTSGALTVETMSGVGGGRLELGAAKATWKVRAYCSGRAEVARRAPVEVPEGVERYLVQCWPADA
ncbi:hypothetical protein [Streptomyces sp. NPDC005017]|uniref:hypothetical protein n=1 Tax=Streptomyces sp. NPDC005017 TaxID=3364706 RepID=UPI00367C2675